MRKLTKRDAETLAWANGLRPDSPRFHEEPNESDPPGPVCLGCGSRGCDDRNCGPLDKEE